MKIRLEIELEYDDDLMTGGEPESRAWFLGHILTGTSGKLILHSNEIGDELGPVTVIRQIEPGMVVTGEGVAPAVHDGALVDARITTENRDTREVTMTVTAYPTTKGEA